MTKTMTRPPKSRAPISQSRSALKVANAKRSANARVCVQLSRAEVSLEEALDLDCVDKTQLKVLLEALPHTKRRSTERSRSIVSAEKIAKRSGLDLSREVKSISCIRTRAILLDAAYDVVGQTAWIFAADKPPKLLPPKQVTAEQKEAGRAQREAALAKANETRLRRSQIKAALMAGEMSFKEVLEDDACATWELSKLMRHIPVLDRDSGEHRGFTPGRVAKVLRICGIRGTKQAGKLTSRQIDSLVSVVNRHFRFIGPKKDRSRGTARAKARA